MEVTWGQQQHYHLQMMIICPIILTLYTGTDLCHLDPSHISTGQPHPQQSLVIVTVAPTAGEKGLRMGSRVYFMYARCQGSDF